MVIFSDARDPNPSLNHLKKTGKINNCHTSLFYTWWLWPS